MSWPTRCVQAISRRCAKSLTHAVGHMELSQDKWRYFGRGAGSGAVFEIYRMLNSGDGFNPVRHLYCVTNEREARGQGWTPMPDRIHVSRGREPVE